MEPVINGTEGIAMQANRTHPRLSIIRRPPTGPSSSRPSSSRPSSSRPSSSRPSSKLRDVARRRGSRGHASGSHRRRDVPAGRTVHLIDIENLVGDPTATEGVADALDRCLRAACWAPGDHLLIAGHQELLLEARRATGLDFQMLPARGPDGADLRLLRAAPPAFLADRYRRVVIASGDHIFTDLAAHLGSLGIPVWVIAPRRCISTTLRLAAQMVIAIDPYTPVFKEAS